MCILSAEKLNEKHEGYHMTHNGLLPHLLFWEVLFSKRFLKYFIILLLLQVIAVK